MVGRGALLALAVLGCTPSRYALPSRSLRNSSAMVDEGGLRVTIRPVTEESLLQARFQWQERPLYWGVRHGLQDRDLVLPLVPLPSLEVVLENTGDQPITFDQATIAVEDDSGGSLSFAAHPDEYLPRVVDQLLARAPELWFIRLQWGPAIPEYPGPFAWFGPILALREEARAVPLLGPQVVVPPRGRWIGALVLTGSSASPTELLRGRLHVRWSGVRAGGRVLDPKEVALSFQERAGELICSDGRRTKNPDDCSLDGYREWLKDGPCVQLGLKSRRPPGGGRGAWLNRTPHWIDGKRVTNSELQGALLDLPASQQAERKSLQLTVAGYVLMAGGVFGAAGTAAGLGGAGYLKEAPAGVSVLALSGVGAILYHLGQRSHSQAVRDYNRYAFKTGACAAPW